MHLCVPLSQMTIQSWNSSNPLLLYLHRGNLQNKLSLHLLWWTKRSFLCPWKHLKAWFPTIWTQRGKILQSEIQLHQLFVCNYFTTCVCTLVSRLTICSKKKSIPLEISLHSWQDIFINSIANNLQDISLYSLQDISKQSIANNFQDIVLL